MLLACLQMAMVQHNGEQLGYVWVGIVAWCHVVVFQACTPTSNGRVHRYLDKRTQLHHYSGIPLSREGGTLVLLGKELTAMCSAG